MRKLGIIVAIICIAITAQAQENIVKLGLGSAINGQINLEYERVLTEKSSILGEFTYRIPSSLPQSFFDQVDLLVLGTQNNIQLETGELSGFLFAAEYRFYTKETAPQGLYFSPYLKLSNNRVDLTGTYTNSSSGNSDIVANAGLGIFTASVGGNIGYQWLIAEKVTINWNILGLGVGYNIVSGEFTAKDNGVFEDFKRDVELFLEPFPGLSNAILEADELNQTIKASGGFAFPTARVSLSIGYAF